MIKSCPEFFLGKYRIYDSLKGKRKYLGFLDNIDAQMRALIKISCFLTETSSKIKKFLDDILE